MSESPRTYFLSGMKWLGIGRLFTQTVSWSMTFFVLRLLSPTDYGLVALAVTITGLFGLIAEFGFGAAITQAKSLRNEQLSSLFGYALILNAAVTLLVSAVAPLVAIAYNEERLTSIIQVASCQFVIAAIGMLPDALLRRQMRFHEMAKIEIGSGVLGGVLTLTFAYLGLHYWALIAGTLCISILRTIFLYLIVKQAFLWPSFAFGPVRDLVKFGGLTMVGRIVGHFLSQADILIAGIFLGKDALGVYSVAMQVASLPLSRSMSVVNQVVFPVLAQMDNDGARRSDTLLAGGKLITYVLFPALWGLAAVAPFVVMLFMGERWRAAILPMQLVCLALPLRAISTLLTTAVSARGRADIDLKNTITGAIVLPGCFYVGIQYGVAGLAYAWIIGIPIMTVINVRRSAPALGIKGSDVLSLIAGPVATTVLMFAALSVFYLALPPNYASVPYFIAAVVVGILSNALALAVVDPKYFSMFMGIFRRRIIA